MEIRWGVKIRPEQIVKQILTTKGINSKVLVPGDRQPLKTLGHVGLFDFDGISRKRVLDETMNLEGINILWESSSTGYHVWNLTVRPVDEIALLGLRLGADSKHVAHGYRQGKWVLRITPKMHYGIDDSVGYRQYKPAPKLLHTWANDSLRTQSEPHFKMFVALTGKTIAQANLYEFVGLSAEQEVYMTMSDKLKRAVSK